MTTYSNKITIDDSESIMLKFALELTIKQCQEKIEAGAGTPYWEHNQSTQSVLERLHEDVTQTSVNNFSKSKDINSLILKKNGNLKGEINRLVVK